MFPWMIFPIFPTPIPRVCDDPPTLYSLLNSIVNFNKEEKTKIIDLAKEGRSTVFDFEYPLSSVIDKELFETQILNKFLMRRIGYETFTAWQIALNVKLNEIMPSYNKLFDALESWNIFNDGLTIDRTLNDNKLSDRSTNLSSETNTKAINEATTEQDLRSSKLPQNEIQDVRNGSYMTDYGLNQNRDSAETDSTSTNQTASQDALNEKIMTTEIIKHTESNKIDIYTKFLENRNSIMSMIYKELDVLFFQIAD